MRAGSAPAALGREVAALRCGLDGSAWDADGGAACTKALGGPRTRPLRFDHARAHALYRALFGEVEDLIRGRHLLIVPSGPLTQLPFQVLVTKAPASNNHRLVAWLAREHAITVLPAAPSLMALRRVGRSSAAPRPMIGIGNPLLDGPDARFEGLARQAQAKQRCPDRRPRQVAARSDRRSSAARVATRAGLADVADIRGQVPLPETADELCAVARDVKAAAGRDILLGARATEREVKRLSAAGELATYRMVHFATHGVLAGDLAGTHEPGLILTPPDRATEEDDGYLSASEIAALKLDADWVILSACNTAAGAAANAEALSGLARAFIYAQARSLFVSHYWEVYSAATVKLITAAVREMARDPKAGRAEALRRSMLALIDKGAPREAHPAYWAPFVLVGEGGRGR
jgi:CHAT domain-containing protein